MAEYKRCDRCQVSNENNDRADIRQVGFWMTEPTYPLRLDSRVISSRDLCANCRRELVEFLKPAQGIPF
jgi:hypothetical protein